MNTRLSEHYKQNVVPALMQEFKYSTPMQVPRLEKIVLNCGVGEMTHNGKAMDFVVYAMTQISGQKPVVTKSRKAISGFKLRENLSIGCMVTLRQQRMFDFFDRLISVALPRVRDFRGVPTRGFDGRGNYTLGIKEQTIFPEIVYDEVVKVRGMDIVFVTTAKTNEEALDLLKGFGLPFKK